MMMLYALFWGGHGAACEKNEYRESLDVCPGLTGTVDHAADNCYTRQYAVVRGHI